MFLEAHDRQIIQGILGGTRSTKALDSAFLWAGAPLPETNPVQFWVGEYNSDKLSPKAREYLLFFLLSC